MNTLIIYIQNLNRSSANDYIKCISEKIINTVPELGTEKLISKNDVDIKIPTLGNYKEILKFNHTLVEIKKFASFYKIKTTGSKKDILNRVYAHFHLSHYCIKIQKIFRGNLYRKYIHLHGPAYKKRSLCTNDTDFVTLDPLSDLKFDYFFSYKDIDDFIYGFDIVSLYNLIQNNGCETTNPYNRNKIPYNLVKKIYDIVRIASCINISLDLNIKDDTISPTKSVEFRALELFQKIDALGNYSDSQWFLSLNRLQLFKFMRELSDIFLYRAQLTHEVKRNICPPNGDPFFNTTNIQYIQYEPDMTIVRNLVLSILEKFVTNGINTDSKSLGAYYVLAALTLVNESAAEALPWLYQSVVYI
jgi:hypothetical protein